MGKNELKEKTRKWLSTEGFHLEMKVAKKFSNKSFEVLSSQIYEDPIKKIGREIDVISTKGTFLDKHTIFDITFVIECKYSKDKPWVLFKSSRQDYYGQKYNFMFRNSSEHAKVILLELENFDNELKDNFLFSFNNNLYYGVKRAFLKKNEDNNSKGNDSKGNMSKVHKSKDNKSKDNKSKGNMSKDNMINEAINQVCNATYARGLKINNFNKSYISNLEIQFPVIVVDGILFESYLNEKFEIVLKEIDYGRLMVSKPELGNEKFFIDIVSFNFLDEYINLASKATENILNYSDKLETTKKIINDKNRA